MENKDEKECHGLCPGGSGIETPIPCYVAKDEHGICIRHGKMKTNGELRFRLNCSDGSGYIRTQTSNKEEGWQNSHYHKQLRETYIVEKGWIGYIENKDGKIKKKLYKAGGLFTTIPNVAHNIYMPPNAVTHTVKHGVGAPLEKPDWFNDTVDCKELDRIICSQFKGKLKPKHFWRKCLRWSPRHLTMRHSVILMFSFGKCLPGQLPFS